MLALLQQAESVFVNFDPRREGVVVPAHLKRQPRVVLQYGLNMRIPIPDLDVGEDGVGATLSFDRAPTWTFVPWSAIFAIVSQDHKGMLWEADVPRDFENDKRPEGEGPRAAAEPVKGAAKSAGGRARKSATPKRPALRALEGGQSEAPREDVRPRPTDARTTDARTTDARTTGARATDARASEPHASTEDAQISLPPPDEEPSAPRDGEARPSDEIVEPPPREPKKKRELPPYLRIVK
jgi:hypothetical protein